MIDRDTSGGQEMQPGGRLVFGGRYYADRELARGGMSTVYAGRDAVLDRPVAIKVLRPEPGRDVQDDFLQEARAAAALKHPHIVDVYDAGIEGDTPFIVMEYVPGETLRELVAREAPLAPDRAAAIVAAVAEALDYAHRRGTLHCDIKPGNILLPAEDSPKLVDFGVARHLMAGESEAGEIAGTAGYVSPEQAGGQVVDARSDVYGLSAVLYEMVTGARAQEARGLIDVRTEVQAGLPPRPEQRNPAVPEHLSDIIMQGLDPDPNRRIGTAGVFAAALRQFRGGLTQQLTQRIARPAAADPVPLATYRLNANPARTIEQPVRRSRAPLVAAFLVLLGIAVAAGIVLAVNVFGDGSETNVSTPNLLNRRLDEAAELARGTGLRIAAPVEMKRSQEPFGQVIGQSPPAGTRLTRSSEVRLTVSLGP